MALGCWPDPPWGRARLGGCRRSRLVLVRDTKDRTGPVVQFSPGAWGRFVDTIKRTLADRVGFWRKAPARYARVMPRAARRPVHFPGFCVAVLLAPSSVILRTASRVVCTFHGHTYGQHHRKTLHLPRSLSQSVPPSVRFRRGPRRKRSAQRPHTRALCLYGQCAEYAAKLCGRVQSRPEEWVSARCLSISTTTTVIERYP
jgi:hypothetical protein